jgi:tetratricopeptide (TPR) repeat protein
MERPLEAAAWAGVGREWVRKARLSSDPGFYLGVAGCSDVALKVEAAFTPALELKTLVLMNDHRFREARRLAEEILSRDPESFVALGAKSDALLELGLYHEAALVAQRQMSLRPGMAAFARGSYLHWLRGDTRRAREFIKDALSGRDARDPEPAAWTFAEAAAIFWHEADYGGADAVYAEALRWVPDYTPALVGRGRVAIARDQPQAAVSFLEKAHRLRPLAETAWLLGDAREMAGDARGAEHAWAEVVRQGRRGDRLTLALFYATKNRDVHEALRLAEEERAARGGIYVDDTYAWALYRAGRLAEARQASDRALRLGTRDARLLYHAGAIRLAGGDAPGGRRLVQRALALNPRFDRTSAAEAQGLLAAAPKPAAAPKQLAANATGAGR